MEGDAAASDTAVQLLATAATAAGPAPADPTARAAWLADVADLGVSLYRQAQALDADIALLAQCTAISGVICKVTEIAGRGVIKFRPTIGADRTTLEDIRTPWLNEPRGAALYEQATALIGWNCRFGKWYEQITEGQRKGQKVRMVAWIEAISQDATPATRTDPPTSPLLELRPQTPTELLEVAAEHFRLDKDTVAAKSMATIGPHKGQPRTPDELYKVWVALVADHAAA